MLRPNQRVGSHSEQAFPIVRSERPNFKKIANKVRLQFKRFNPIRFLIQKLLSVHRETMEEEAANFKGKFVCSRLCRLMCGSGCALPSRLSSIPVGFAPDVGHSPQIRRPVRGGAKPPPHIRRQSRESPVPYAKGVRQLSKPGVAASATPGSQGPLKKLFAPTGRNIVSFASSAPGLVSITTRDDERDRRQKRYLKLSFGNRHNRITDKS